MTTTAGLMITASHQIFSGQLWHLTDQTKFDQTNLLCIINGEVNKFTIGKQMSRQFSTLIISTATAENVHNHVIICTDFSYIRTYILYVYTCTYIDT